MTKRKGMRLTQARYDALLIFSTQSISIADAVIAGAEREDVQWLWKHELLTVIRSEPLVFEITHVGEAALKRVLETGALHAQQEALDFMTAHHRGTVVAPDGVIKRVMFLALDDDGEPDREHCRWIYESGVRRVPSDGEIDELYEKTITAIA